MLSGSSGMNVALGKNQYPAMTPPQSIMQIRQKLLQGETVW